MRKKRDYAALYNQVSLAKAHELPAGSRAAPRVVKGAEPGINVESDISSIHQIAKDFALSERDTPFDITGLVETQEHQPLMGGYPMTLITRQVQPQERIIIQNFCFFSMVDNSPVDPLARNILAEPMEYCFNYRWSLLSGDTPIGQDFLHWRRFGLAPLQINHDGFTILTRDPSGFDTTMSLHYICKPGKPLKVVVNRMAMLSAVQNQRIPRYHGCRVRGFVRPIT